MLQSEFCLKKFIYPEGFVYFCIVFVSSSCILIFADSALTSAESYKDFYLIFEVIEIVNSRVHNLAYRSKRLTTYNYIYKIIL